MSTAGKVADSRAVEVRLTDEELIVLLDDGRTVTAPIADFPRLAYATEEELRDYQLIGGGTGIHWPQIDEDISIETLLVGGCAPGETAASFERWKEEMDRRRAVAEKEPWGETLPLPAWWEKQDEPP